MYMNEYKQYSSIEAYKVAKLAITKGLILLEGNYDSCSNTSHLGGNRGYCVAKVIAGQYLTLADDGSFYQDFSYGGTSRCKDVWFCLTLEEAKRRIDGFDGIIKNYPRFFAFVRVYREEPEYCGLLQQLCLDGFAREHGIVYADKIMCVGGQESEIWHPECSVGIDDVIDCCWKLFSQITADDFLVVTDFSRLNDELDLWKNSYNIMSVGYEDTGYTKYEYHESEKLKEEIRYWEKLLEDREYEAMNREYEEMKLELGLDEQPYYVDAKEEEREAEYEECCIQHD